MADNENENIEQIVDSTVEDAVKQRFSIREGNLFVSTKDSGIIPPGSRDNKLPTSITGVRVSTPLVDSNRVNTDDFILNNQPVTDVSHVIDDSSTEHLVSSYALNQIRLKMKNDISSVQDQLNNKHITPIISDVITPPYFNTDSNWTKTNVSYSNGQCVYQNNNTFVYQRQGILRLDPKVFTVPGMYFVVIDVDRLDSGNIQLLDTKNTVLREITVSGEYFNQVYVEDASNFVLMVAINDVSPNDRVVIDRIYIYHIQDRAIQYLDYVGQMYAVGDESGIASMDWTTARLAEFRDLMRNDLTATTDSLSVALLTHEGKVNPHNTTYVDVDAAPTNHTHTPQECGAAPEHHMHTPDECSAAPVAHTHIPQECGAAAVQHSHLPEECGAAPVVHTHTSGECGAAPLVHSHTAAEVGAAPLVHTHNYDECNAAPVQHTHTPQECGSAPENHIHTPDQCDAAPKRHTHVPEECGAAPLIHSHTANECSAAEIVHTHTPEQCGAAPEVHTHDLSGLGVAAVNHTHEPDQCGAAPVTHTHAPEECGAAPEEHTHEPDQCGAAPVEHTHTPQECGAAPEEHTHDLSGLGVAPAIHTHMPDECGAAPESHSHMPEDCGAAPVIHTHDITELEHYEIITNHFENRNNPHDVTKDQVGLGNIENYNIASVNDFISGAENKYATANGVNEYIDKLFSDDPTLKYVSLAPKKVLEETVRLAPNADNSFTVSLNSNSKYEIYITGQSANLNCLRMTLGSLSSYSGGDEPESESESESEDTGDTGNNVVSSSFVINNYSNSWMFGNTVDGNNQIAWSYENTDGFYLTPKNVGNNIVRGRLSIDTSSFNLIGDFQTWLGHYETANVDARYEYYSTVVYPLRFHGTIDSETSDLSNLTFTLRIRHDHDRNNTIDTHELSFNITVYEFVAVGNEANQIDPTPMLIRQKILGTTVPFGWSKEDGSTLSRDAYSELVAYLERDSLYISHEEYNTRIATDGYCPYFWMDATTIGLPTMPSTDTGSINIIKTRMR